MLSGDCALYVLKPADRFRFELVSLEGYISYWPTPKSKNIICIDFRVYRLKVPLRCFATVIYT